MMKAMLNIQFSLINIISGKVLNTYSYSGLFPLVNWLKRILNSHMGWLPKILKNWRHKISISCSQWNKEFNFQIHAIDMTTWVMIGVRTSAWELWHNPRVGLTRKPAVQCHSPMWEGFDLIRTQKHFSKPMKQRICACNTSKANF